MKHKYKTISFLIGILCYFIASSVSGAEIEVLKPGKINIPNKIKKVFIDPNLINDQNDQLHLKSDVVVELKRRLNDLGRFEVTLGSPGGFDPNVETVAVIQGDVISGGEVDDGQLTEKAVCTGGLTGIAGAVTARNTSQQGLTFSRRGMLCKQSNMESTVAEGLTSAGLSLLGVKEFPARDEIIRIYKYKNFSLFCQVNLSFTQIGEIRETLAIQSDAASFSRHSVSRDSYHNVRESGDNAPLVWLMFHITPVAPVIIKEIGIVSESNPGSFSGQWYDRISPKIADIPREERKVIISKLVNKSLDEFIQAVSPYKQKVQIEVASGNSEAKKKIENGKYLEARKILEGTNQADDLYNLGITFEASAASYEDYEDALRNYSAALDKSPDSRLYAQAVGRMEKQLKAFKKLNEQTSK